MLIFVNALNYDTLFLLLAGFFYSLIMSAVNDALRLLNASTSVDFYDYQSLDDTVARNLQDDLIETVIQSRLKFQGLFDSCLRDQLRSWLRLTATARNAADALPTSVETLPVSYGPLFTTLIGRDEGHLEDMVSNDDDPAALLLSKIDAHDAYLRTIYRLLDLVTKKAVQYSGEIKNVMEDSGQMGSVLTEDQVVWRGKEESWKVWLIQSVYSLFFEDCDSVLQKLQRQLDNLDNILGLIYLLLETDRTPSFVGNAMEWYAVLSNIRNTVEVEKVLLLGFLAYFVQDLYPTSVKEAQALMEGLFEKTSSTVSSLALYKEQLLVTLAMLAGESLLGLNMSRSTEPFKEIVQTRNPMKIVGMDDWRDFVNFVETLFQKEWRIPILRSYLMLIWSLTLLKTKDVRRMQDLPLPSTFLIDDQGSQGIYLDDQNVAESWANDSVSQDLFLWLLSLYTGTSGMLLNPLCFPLVRKDLDVNPIVEELASYLEKLIGSVLMTFIFGHIQNRIIQGTVDLLEVWLDKLKQRDRVAFNFAQQKSGISLNVDPLCFYTEESAEVSLTSNRAWQPRSLSKVPVDFYYEQFVLLLRYNYLSRPSYPVNKISDGTFWLKNMAAKRLLNSFISSESSCPRTTMNELFAVGQLVAGNSELSMYVFKLLEASAGNSLATFFSNLQKFLFSSPTDASSSLINNEPYVLPMMVLVKSLCASNEFLLATVRDSITWKFLQMLQTMLNLVLVLPTHFVVELLETIFVLARNAKSTNTHSSLIQQSQLQVLMELFRREMILGNCKLLSRLISLELPDEFLSLGWETLGIIMNRSPISVEVSLDEWKFVSVFLDKINAKIIRDPQQFMIGYDTGSIEIFGRLLSGISPAVLRVGCHPIKNAIAASLSILCHMISSDSTIVHSLFLQKGLFRSILTWMTCRCGVDPHFILTKFIPADTLKYSSFLETEFSMDTESGFRLNDLAAKLMIIISSLPIFGSILDALLLEDDFLYSSSFISDLSLVVQSADMYPDAAVSLPSTYNIELPCLTALQLLQLKDDLNLSSSCKQLLYAIILNVGVPTLLTLFLGTSVFGDTPQRGLVSDNCLFSILCGEATLDELTLELFRSLLERLDDSLVVKRELFYYILNQSPIFLLLENSIAAATVSDPVEIVQKLALFKSFLGVLRVCHGVTIDDSSMASKIVNLLKGLLKFITIIDIENVSNDEIEGKSDVIMIYLETPFFDIAQVSRTLNNEIRDTLPFVANTGDVHRLNLGVSTRLRCLFQYNLLTLISQLAACCLSRVGDLVAVRHFFGSTRPLLIDDFRVFLTGVKEKSCKVLAEAILEFMAVYCYSAACDNSPDTSGVDNIIVDWEGFWDLFDPSISKSFSNTVFVYTLFLKFHEKKPLLLDSSAYLVSDPRSLIFFVDHFLIPDIVSITSCYILACKVFVILLPFLKKVGWSSDHHFLVDVLIKKSESILFGSNDTCKFLIEYVINFDLVPLLLDGGFFDKLSLLNLSSYSPDGKLEGGTAAPVETVDVNRTTLLFECLLSLALKAPSKLFATKAIHFLVGFPYPEIVASQPAALSLITYLLSLRLSVGPEFMAFLLSVYRVSRKALHLSSEASLVCRSSLFYFLALMTFVPSLKIVPFELELHEYVEHKKEPHSSSVSSKVRESREKISLGDFSKFIQELLFTMDKQASCGKSICDADKCLLELSFKLLYRHLEVSKNQGIPNDSSLRTHFNDWIFKSGLKSKLSALHLDSPELVAMK